MPPHYARYIGKTKPTGWRTGAEPTPIDLPDDFGSDDPDGNRMVLIIITAALFITIAGSAAILWSVFA